MLDKRLWLESRFNLPWVTFKDYVDIDGDRYYYGETETKGKIYNKNYEEIYSEDIREWNPTHLIKWAWAWWQIIIDATETINNLEPVAKVLNPSVYESTASYSIWDWVTSWSNAYICIKDATWISPTNIAYWATAEEWADVIELQPYYQWWLIGLIIPWHWRSEWSTRYITFTTGILKWLTKRIYYAVWEQVYIFGTDGYGSLPETDEKYYVFSDPKDVLVLWSDTWINVLALTDIKWAWDFYYHIALTYWYINLYPLDIDWVKVLLNWEDDVENKNILEWVLSSDYVVEIDNLLLFIYRVDWWAIAITQLDSILKLDINFSWAGLWIYPSIWINFDWTIIAYNSSTLWWSTPYLLNRYDDDWIQNQDSFRKMDFYKYIRDNLPVWYSYKMVETEDKYISTLDTLWITIKEWFLWYDFYIRKDDLQENAVTRSDTYSMKVYINTSWVTSPATIVINVDGIDHSIYVDTQHEWTIATEIINYFNTHTDFSAYKIFHSGWDAYYLDISHIDWRQLNPSTTYSKITVSENNFNIEWSNYYYGVGLTWAIPADAFIYNPLSTIRNVNDNTIFPYNVLKGTEINNKQNTDIIDIQEFEWALFTLTPNFIYFSRVDFDSNTQFYPLDNLTYKGWEKLIPFGHSLIVIWETNKLIKKTIMKRYGRDMTSYLMKDLEFNWDLFSKYSYLYTDGVLYLLQSDKRLMTLQVVENDATESRIATQEISKWFRYLFEEAEWECFMSQEWEYINVLVINWEKTTNYQFDISRNIWLQNEYNTPVYHIWDEILTKDYIAIENWYTDFWVEYSQEINFSIWNLINLTKVDIMRTIFGLNHQDNLDITLIIEREEEAGNLETETHTLNNYYFDTMLDPEPDLDELPWQEIQEVYEWNIASIQTQIERAWRFMRFQYKSENRFIIGNTYLLTKASKPYVNDILTSN
jgi:hypothetical protein